LNQYNPQNNKPYERPHLNSGVDLYEPLTDALLELRKSEAALCSRRRKDEVTKYFNETWRYSQVMKGKGN
jgi:hypothetical protein